MGRSSSERIWGTSHLPMCPQQRRNVLPSGSVILWWWVECNSAFYADDMTKYNAQRSTLVCTIISCLHGRLEVSLDEGLDQADRVTMNAVEFNLQSSGRRCGLIRLVHVLDQVLEARDPVRLGGNSACENALPITPSGLSVRRFTMSSSQTALLDGTNYTRSLT